MSAPPWPSLYNPFLDLLSVAHHSPIQPGGEYLHDANGQSLCDNSPPSSDPRLRRLPLHLLLVPRLPPPPLRSLRPPRLPQHRFRPPRTAATSSPSPTPPARSSSPPSAPQPPPPARPGAHHPSSTPHSTRAAYALLVLAVYLLAGLLAAAVGSAVIAYLLAALYKAGRFHMSTCVLNSFLSLSLSFTVYQSRSGNCSWMPPIFALVQTLIGLLGYVSRPNSAARMSS
ncbi:hypothetical protein EW145_g8495 [Phellinidium pouzarii]|uniref:Uncharacterized protein n=1 Tax=Phellinidium pouzarii TaxID=167371 RepID=A0A4S4KA02_9AGAM|nr:hypothetical protein EW145_g8495 [Phellinidium pouzarii]